MNIDFKKVRLDLNAPIYDINSLREYCNLLGYIIIFKPKRIIVVDQNDNEVVTIEEANDLSI